MLGTCVETPLRNPRSVRWRTRASHYRAVLTGLCRVRSAKTWPTRSTAAPRCARRTSISKRHFNVFAAPNAHSNVVFAGRDPPLAGHGKVRQTWRATTGATAPYAGVRFSPTWTPLPKRQSFQNHRLTQIARSCGQPSTGVVSMPGNDGVGLSATRFKSSSSNYRQLQRAAQERR